MSAIPPGSSGERGAPLDFTRLLNDLPDQPELIGRLLRTFIAETRKDFDGLAAAFAASDPGQVARFAHRLKGAAGTVGAEPLCAEAERIERLAMAGRIRQARDRMQALHREFDRLHEYIAEF